jgi:hypothetical protein
MKSEFHWIYLIIAIVTSLKYNIHVFNKWDGQNGVKFVDKRQECFLIYAQYLHGRCLQTQACEKFRVMLDNTYALKSQ